MVEDWRLGFSGGNATVTRYTFSPDVLALNPDIAEMFCQGKRATKYGNVPTTIDGIRFDSRKEAQDYVTLKLLEQSGQIRDLVLQPRFTLQTGGGDMRSIEYVADFMWLDTHTGKMFVRDSKGHQTDVFKLKAKMFRRLYPQYVYEVG